MVVADQSTVQVTVRPKGGLDDDAHGDDKSTHRGGPSMIGQREKVRIECDENEHCLVCRLVGDLEDVAVSQFREGLARSSGKKRVIFEFSGVRFVSSTGLSALIRAIRCVHETGGTAAICAATPRVKV